ncbi:MAG: hypothetical protein K8R23_20290 [Chthoniobacter sp.]|nr:hypothetical protein [Chthoniobacter sp.]
MSFPDTLTAHAEVCGDLYELMLAENRLLKASAHALEEPFLNRKRAMLVSLTNSLEKVRISARLRASTTPEMRAAMEKVQQIILKTLLLDRENEQLLLKTTLHPRIGSSASAPAPALHQVQRAYSQFS